MDAGSPTIRRRRLGRALRDLRQRRGLTGDAAGMALDRSGSWISRVEGGRVGVRTRDLRDLLDLYGLADTRRREELEALAREGKQRGWWSRYAEALPEPLVVYIGLESAARSISAYHDRSVPGLLQTESYCRAIHRQGITTTGPLSSEEVETRVQARMARQVHLEQDPPRLNYLLDEAVLYRTIGGRETLKEQLEQLLVVARRPHVNLRVIPFTHGDRVAVTGSYTIMSFREDPDVAWLETPIGLTYEDGDAEVGVYRMIFDRLAKAALKAEATNALFRKAKEKLS